MKKSEELFALIKSMKPREKAYFKRYTNLHSDSQFKDYLLLFNELDKMSKFDERLLVRKLHTSLTKHLSAKKNYLYRLILDCLVSYKKQSNRKTTLQKKQSQIEVLLSKGFTNIAEKYLNKAKQEARKFEFWEMMLGLLHQQSLIAYQKNQFITTREDKLILEERQDVLFKLSNLNEFQQLRWKVRMMKNLLAKKEYQEKVFSEFEKIVSTHPLLKNPANALTIKARNEFYNILVTIHYTRKDYHLALNTLEQYLHFFEQHEEVLSFESDYSDIMNNFLLVCVKANELKRFEAGIQKLEGILEKENNQKIIAKIKYVQLISMLEFCYSNNSKTIGFLNEKNLPEKVDAIQSNISEEQQLRLSFYTARYYFSIENFDIAIDWLVKVEFSNEQYLDMILLAKLMKVIVFFEEKNASLVISECRSADRLIRKYDFQDSTVLTNSVKYFKRLANAMKHNNFQKLLIEFQECLAAVKEDEGNAVVLKNFDITNWVSSKATEYSTEKQYALV